MIDGVATLISQQFSKDEIGQFIANESRTEVYVAESNITRAEFYNAGRQGLNPEIVLITPIVNYDGQRIVEYRGRRFGVYRTFTNNEDIELYLTDKGGIDGTQENEGS